MKVLIVDDESLARARLKRLLAQHPEFVLVGEAACASDAVTAARALQPDLVFLDIEMRGHPKRPRLIHGLVKFGILQNLDDFFGSHIGIPTLKK